MELRFKVGDKVMANVGELGYLEGTVIKLWQLSDALGTRNPYMIQLDEEIDEHEDGVIVVVIPRDTDEYVRAAVGDASTLSQSSPLYQYLNSPQFTSVR